MSKKFRLICVLDATEEQGLSKKDVSPNYLHIHALEADDLESLENFVQKFSAPTEKSGTLYQWGKPAHLVKNTRRETVSASEITEHGQIGIGSAWHGSEKSGGMGGGEGFYFDKKNVRITRGNGVFDMSEKEKYWIFEVMDFSGAKKISELRGQIDGREDLKRKLLREAGNKPFMACFDAEVGDDFFTRSNGIFPQDHEKVEKPEEALFAGGKRGGHVVGGSRNEGDLKSLREKFEDPSAVDFSLRIVSDVVLQPITEVRIKSKHGEFRSPRTETKPRERAPEQLAKRHNKLHPTSPFL